MNQSEKDERGERVTSDLDMVVANFNVGCRNCLMGVESQYTSFGCRAHALTLASQREEQKNMMSSSLALRIVVLVVLMLLATSQEEGMCDS